MDPNEHIADTLPKFYLDISSTRSQDELFLRHREQLARTMLARFCHESMSLASSLPIVLFPFSYRLLRRIIVIPSHGAVLNAARSGM